MLNARWNIDDRLRNPMRVATGPDALALLDQLAIEDNAPGCSPKMAQWAAAMRAKLARAPMPQSTIDDRIAVARRIRSAESRLQVLGSRRPIADIYDAHHVVFECMQVLWPDFEYPNVSHLTVAQFIKAAAIARVAKSRAEVRRAVALLGGRT